MPACARVCVCACGLTPDGCFQLRVLVSKCRCSQTHRTSSVGFRWCYTGGACTCEASKHEKFTWKDSSNDDCFNCELPICTQDKGKCSNYECQCRSGTKKTTSNGGTCFRCSIPQGETCSDSEGHKCDGYTCRGGKCCGDKGQAAGCAKCNSNGHCDSCASGYILSNSACVKKKADGGSCTLGDRECTGGSCKNGKCCGTKGKPKECTSCDGSGNCAKCSSGHILGSGACTATTTTATATTTTTTLKANGGRCSSGTECLSSSCQKGRCVEARKPGTSCSSGYDCSSSVCRGSVCCSSKGSSVGCRACAAKTGLGDCTSCSSDYVLADKQCKQTTTTTTTETTTTLTTTSATTTTVTVTTTTTTLPPVKCKTNEYRLGNNPGVCKPCSNVSCKGDTYRTGSCTGTSNNFKCVQQPRCQAGRQYLSGATGTKKGQCLACSNMKCASGQYRTGGCQGSTNGFQCRLQPKCKTGEYLSGASATAQGTCKPQTTCQKGQLLSGASAAAAGVCQACPSTAFQGASNHRHPACQRVAVCKQGQYEATKPTGTSDRVCATHGKCSTVQYEAKAPTATTNRQCVELSQCRAGERITTPPKRDSNGIMVGDLSCGPCNDGGFQDEKVHRIKSCKALPSCPSKQYLKGSSKTARGTCAACANLQCPTNEFQGGACGGTTNGLTCTACRNVNCADNEYREGKCGARTNGYRCQEQPACAQNEFLAGAGKLQRGSCETTSTTTTTTSTTTTATTTTTTVTTTTATTTTTTTTTTRKAPSGCNANCTNSLYSNNECDLECNTYYCRYDHGACSRAMSKDVQQARLFAKLGKTTEAQALFEIVCDGLSAFPPDKSTWLNISGLEHKARVKEYDYQRMFSVTSCISAKNLGLPKTFTGEAGALVNNDASFDAKKHSVLGKLDALRAIDEQIARVSQLSKLFAHRENVGSNIHTKGLGQLDEKAYRMIAEQLTNSTVDIQAFVNSNFLANQTGGVDPSIALLAKDMRSIIGNSSKLMAKTIHQHTKPLRDHAVSNVNQLAQVLSLQRRMVVDMMNKAASGDSDLDGLETEVDEFEKDVEAYLEGTQRFGERIGYLNVYQDANPVDVDVGDLSRSEVALALSQRLLLVGLKRDRAAWDALTTSVKAAIAGLLANTLTPEGLTDEELAGVNAAMREEKKETTGFSLLDGQAGKLTYSQKKTLSEIEANSEIVRELEPEEKDVVRKVLAGAISIRELEEAPRKAVNDIMIVQRAITGFSHIYDEDGDGLACAKERVALALDAVVPVITPAGIMRTCHALPSCHPPH